MTSPAVHVMSYDQDGVATGGSMCGRKRGPVTADEGKVTCPHCLTRIEVGKAAVAAQQQKRTKDRWLALQG
jgi:hypothetical protein